MDEIVQSTANPLVKKVCLLQKSRKLRYQEGLVVVEGENVCRELVKHTTAVHLLLLNDPLVINTFADCSFRLVEKSVMKKMSDCKTAPKALGVFPMPKWDLPKKASRHLVLDGVADPGNMGGLFRSAAAFGWDVIFITEGSLDPYNPKVIRSSKGAVFSIPILQMKREEIPLCSIVFIADTTGKPFREVQVPSSLMLVLGGEAKGVDFFWEGQQKITIPLERGVESLNVGVAGAIVMEQFRAKR